MTRLRLLSLFLILIVGCAGSKRSAGQVNLLAMGDWGNNGPKQHEMAKVLADYAEQERPPIDAMLLAGDNFYIKLTGIDDPRWEEAFERMYDPKRLDFPFYATFGNHDYSNKLIEMELAYAQARPESRWKMPGRWYRLDLPVKKPIVTILMLDSNRPLMGEQLWNDQLAWMRSELSKPRSTSWLMCVAHHPLFSNGDHGDNGVLQKEWGPIFQEFKVDFYIAGHDHDIQHLSIPGYATEFVMVGGGGATTRPMRVDNRGPFSSAINGFANLKLDERRATVRLVDPRGGVLHEFEVDRSGRSRILRTMPSDRAVPRTAKTITRGGEENATTQATIAPTTSP